MNSVFQLLKCQGEAYIYLLNFPKLLLLKLPYWLRILLSNSKSETTDQQVHRFWLQAVVLKTSKNVKSSNHRNHPPKNQQGPFKNEGFENPYFPGFWDDL